MHYPNWVIPTAIFSLCLAPTGGTPDAYEVASKNYAAGNYATARDQLLSLAGTARDSYQIEYQLGNCYLQLKDYEKAEEWYLACLANGPDVATLSNTETALECIAATAATAISHNSKHSQQL